MRVIHDIESEPQVTCGGHPYLGNNGFSASILIVARHPITGDAEAVRIEGNAYFVKKALIEALAGLESIAKLYVDDGSITENWEELAEAECKKLSARCSPKKEPT